MSHGSTPSPLAPTRPPGRRRLSRAANRSADPSLDSRSSSGCASATITSRCGESARRRVPIERRSSTSRPARRRRSSGCRT